MISNEILLLESVILIYGTVLVAYRVFHKTGLYVMTAILTILANIEVLMMVDGFGMEQTLGNVMFAATYLVTDILSENESEKDAAKAVWLGGFSAAVVLLFTQYWMLYTLAPSDWAGEHIHAIFSTTPRMLFASLSVYMICQRFDVWMYHFWWKLTEKKSGSSKKFLWLRNNVSTLFSQMINTVFFTLFAFAGWYDTKTIISIMLSSYVIYIFTSLLDTPAVYLARWMKEKGLAG